METRRTRNPESQKRIIRSKKADPKYKLLTPNEVFDLPSQATDDALFSLRVYAAAYFIFSADFRDPLGQASLDLLDECAYHFAGGHEFNLR